MKSKEKFLTLEILRKNRACQGRYLYLVEKLGADWKDDQPLTLSKILEVNGTVDCLWAFKCFDLSLANDLNRITGKTAVFTAKKVLPFWTDKFPNDDRPAKAIEAAEDYLANSTKEAATIVLIAAGAATEAGEAAEAVRERVAARAAHAIAYSVYDPVYPDLHASHCFSEILAQISCDEIIKRHVQRLLAERSL